MFNWPSLHLFPIAYDKYANIPPAKLSPHPVVSPRIDGFFAKSSKTFLQIGKGVSDNGANKSPLDHAYASSGPWVIVNDLTPLVWKKLAASSKFYAPLIRNASSQSTISKSIIEKESSFSPIGHRLRCLDSFRWSKTVPTTFTHPCYLPWRSKVVRLSCNIGHNAVAPKYKIDALKKS